MENNTNYGSSSSATLASPSSDFISWLPSSSSSSSSSPQPSSPSLWCDEVMETDEESLCYTPDSDDHIGSMFNGHQQLPSPTYDDDEAIMLDNNNFDYAPDDDELIRWIYNENVPHDNNLMINFPPVTTSTPLTFGGKPASFLWSTKPQLWSSSSSSSSSLSSPSPLPSTSSSSPGSISNPLSLQQPTVSSSSSSSSDSMNYFQQQFVIAEQQRELQRLNDYNRQLQDQLEEYHQQNLQQKMSIMLLNQQVLQLISENGQYFNLLQPQI
ncbi:putative protein TPRXL [Cotesia glomerata]|uniref:putative protein TPRXL n=1 Tax=Cotesia glomerata TaxID=32391 RepID=UPI001D02E2DA|nr:putative protein TPRXL [Cotesia glomerata]